MNEQAITNMVEGLAELHVEHLKTRKGASFIAYLAKMESEHKGGLENPCCYRSSSFIGRV